MTRTLAPLAPAARLLGFAGLLPQAAFVAVQLVRPDPAWALLAFAYGALILSFLGGIWWGFAVRRTAPRTGLLLAAVAPSLVALALFALGLVRHELATSLVLLGGAIMATLLVDRQLARDGQTPPGWMLLRVPLSLGLGALTMLAAAA